MSEASVRPCWQAVGMVVDQHTKDLLAGRYGSVQEMVAWFKGADLFRAAVDLREIVIVPRGQSSWNWGFPPAAPSARKRP